LLLAFIRVLITRWEVSNLLRQDDYVKSQLVLAGWRHGRKYGGHLGSCIVMSCLANRQKLGWGHWLDVIDSIPKYSATLEQPTGTPSIWSPEFVRLLHEVESLFAGSQDYSRGGLYWCDSAAPITNQWFKEKILGNLEVHGKCCDMNSLMVFK
jgi:hypothetical protein